MQHNAIVVTTQITKGGAGKTTMTNLLGGELSRRGYKVLLIDTDNQKNLTINFGLENLEDKERAKGSFNFIMNSLKDDYDPMKYVVKTDFDNLYMVPSQNWQPSIESHVDKHADQIERLEFVKAAVDPLRPHFDFIIIDCSLIPGVLTFNCYQASDFVLIPADPAPNTRDAMQETYRLVKSNLRRKPNLKFGLVFTAVDKRQNSAKNEIAVIMQAIQENVPEIDLFTTFIRSDVKVKEMQAARTLLHLYRDEHGNKAKALLDVEEFTDDFIKKMAELYPDRDFTTWGDVLDIDAIYDEMLDIAKEKMLEEQEENKKEVSANVEGQ